MAGLRPLADPGAVARAVANLLGQGRLEGLDAALPEIPFSVPGAGVAAVAAAPGRVPNCGPARDGADGVGARAR